MNNYKITVDDYSVIYDKSGFPESVKCLGYIKGDSDVLAGEYSEHIIAAEKMASWASEQYEMSLEEYLDNVTLLEKYVDFELMINKAENRTEVFSEEVSELPEVFASILSSFARPFGPHKCGKETGPSPVYLDETDPVCSEECSTKYSN